MSVREEHLAIERTARLYRIGEPEAASDVWIVCHGYGQLAGRFIRNFEPIGGSGRLIVAPEGLHRFYLDPPPAPAAARRVGATWMTREDRQADIRDYVAYLDRVVRHVKGERLGRVRALGFSQGAATAFRWALLGATRIDDLILWAGEVPPDADMAAAASRLQATRITLIHGDRDEFATSGVAERQQAALGAAGLAARVRTFAGRHTLDRATLQWLAGAD